MQYFNKQFYLENGSKQDSIVHKNQTVEKVHQKCYDFRKANYSSIFISLTMVELCQSIGRKKSIQAFLSLNCATH